MRIKADSPCRWNLASAQGPGRENLICVDLRCCGFWVQRNDPFSIVHGCDGVLGVVGQEAHWDERLRFKCDIDCCLGELLRNRIIWHESRLCFLQAHDKNLGGNSRFRSPDRIAAEKLYLQSKWQAHLRLDTYQSKDRVQVVVERRQRVEL